MSRYQSSVSIPNVLTVVRILLTPLFVILVLGKDYNLALIIFVLAGLSDGLDGLIARCLNQRTAIGAYLDPLADKLLLVSAFIGLAVLDVIPDWVAVIVISRDVIISLGIAIFTMTEKSYEVRPSFISKFTTTAQILTIILALFDPSQSRLTILHLPVLWVTSAVTIISGLHYIYIGMGILQEPNNNSRHQH